MDTDFARPRYRAVPKFSLAQDSLAANKMQTSTISVSASTNIYTSTAPKKIDFSTGAKAYKKKYQLAGLYTGIVRSLYIILSLILVIIAVGAVANYKFSGKALPFTFIGDVSVGGLNKEQIQQKLNAKYQNMTVTFVDGGLVKSVPLSKFYIKPDVKSASDTAIPKRFNPFLFLNWQRQEVPIKIDERVLSGYIQTSINHSKTKEQDASMVIEKNKLVIMPETPGMQTDYRYISKQITNSLAKVSEPVINVNTTTVKPKVLASDLGDDLTKANALLQTPISLKLGYSTIRLTDKQKLSWIKLNQTPGSTNVDIEFSKGLIRAYILELAAKYSNVSQNTPVDSQITTIQNSLAIDNVDEAVDSIVSSLNKGIALNQQLKSRNVSNVIEPSVVNPIITTSQTR